MPSASLVRCEPDQAEPIFRLILAHQAAMTYPVETLSFAEFKEGIFDNGAYFYWVAAGKALALLWLAQPNPYSRSTEFGVIALKGGEGHGRESVRALLDYGFGSIGLHRMFCTVNANNENCLKAIKTFGLLKQEGRLRQARFVGGAFVDQLVFSILESDPRA